MKITLPKWYDLHVHFRQGEMVEEYINAHLAMGCCGALAMPNTKPPVSKITGDSAENSWSIEYYQKTLLDKGADKFDALITPLYLTADTTADMIAKGAKSGLLKSCKYYPPHGTTNADFGAALDTYAKNGVFDAMQEHGIILNIHGEEHGLSGSHYFDQNTNAEDIFYKTRMVNLVKEFPDLKIVCEHITTKTAADFVSSASKNVAATITPQHLLFTVGDLLQGFKYHLYCLPLVKFDADKQALLEAIKNPQNTKFFAGTDSAPHTDKVTPCGCAAGCFTGYIAPQLYAQAFDLNEDNAEVFKQFLCINGAQFYGLPVSQKTFTLEKTPTSIENLSTAHGDVCLLSNGLGIENLEWSLYTDK